MKRLLFILLILPTAFAGADYLAYDQVTLGEGESIILAGRNITLLDVFSNTQIRVSVEDTWKIINENETTLINKVNITVNATLYVSEQKTNYAKNKIVKFNTLNCVNSYEKIFQKL